MDFLQKTGLGILGLCAVILFFLIWWYRNQKVQWEKQIDLLLELFQEDLKDLRDEFDRKFDDAQSRNRQEVQTTLSNLSTVTTEQIRRLGEDQQRQLQTGNESQEKVVVGLKDLVAEKIKGMSDDLRQMTDHTGDQIKSMGDLQRQVVGGLKDLVAQKMEAMSTGMTQMTAQTVEQVQSLGQSQEKVVSEKMKALNDVITTLSTSMVQQVDGMTKFNEKQIAQFDQAVTQKMQEMGQVIEKLETQLKTDFEQLRKSEQEQLNQIRQSVEERLEKRVGDSFKTVEERLQDVSKGVGEMRELARNVGDLKSTLTNVKNRGGWGEAQLESLLSSFLSPKLYESQVAVQKGDAEKVDFVVKIPSLNVNDEPLLLPIDAKFPLEDYSRLCEAMDKGQPEEEKKFRKQLHSALANQAKSIGKKYVKPPRTTDFGLMYLPVEGLYAEAVRDVDFVDKIRREHRVILTGPSTFTALLSTLQIAFQALALHRHSSEIWSTLGQVKHGFVELTNEIAAVKKHAEGVVTKLDSADRLRQKIDKSLRNATSLQEQLEVVEPLPFNGASGDVTLPFDSLTVDSNSCEN